MKLYLCVVFFVTSTVLCDYDVNYLEYLNDLKKCADFATCTDKHCNEQEPICGEYTNDNLGNLSIYFLYANNCTYQAAATCYNGNNLGTHIEVVDRAECLIPTYFCCPPDTLYDILVNKYPCLL